MPMPTGGVAVNSLEKERLADRSICLRDKEKGLNPKPLISFQCVSVQ
jgi:hypothetical protein